MDVFSLFVAYSTRLFQKVFVPEGSCKRVVITRAYGSRSSFSLFFFFYLFLEIWVDTQVVGNMQST